MKAGKVEHFSQFSQSTFFVGVFLLIAAILLIVTTEQRQRDFETNQARLMSEMTRSTANEITYLIQKLRHAVKLFAQDRLAIIQALFNTPDNEHLLQRLQSDARRHFPGHFAISLSQLDGTIVLDDFDGNIGQVCASDIQKFSKTRHPYEIFVHPHAEVYHFDMPVVITADSEPYGIFFVSFRLDEIVRLLRAGAPPEHEFMLVKQDDPDLIEVTSGGARDELGGVVRLSELDKGEAGYQRKVADSRWILLDFPRHGLFQEHRQKLYIQSFVIFFMAVIGGLLALARLKKEESRRKASEASLRKKHIQLEASYKQLEKTRDKLVEAEKMASLGGLVAGVSHEINTPLGVSVTAVSSIEENTQRVKQLLSANELKKSDFEKYLNMVAEAARILGSNLERASQLIRSFKQVAVDQGSETRRAFAICGYVDDILLSLHPQLKKTSHKVEVNCRVRQNIVSYPGALSQIITNLVMNSLHHAFDEITAGVITIDIDLQGDLVLIHYRDNGCGIEPENLNRVFEPFYTTARNKGGSGLGLSIVYNLTVGVLKGKIAAIDTQRNGVHITISFPVSLEID